MTQRLGLAKTLRFVVVNPDRTAEAQDGERRRRKGLFWGSSPIRHIVDHRPQSAETCRSPKKQNRQRRPTVVISGLR